MLTLLCFGDSNTWGYDPRSYFGSRYPNDVRWTGLLEQAGFRVINYGQNGLSIPQQPDWTRLTGLPADGSLNDFDRMTVMLGSNDLLSGASAEETAGRMEKLICCLLEVIRQTDKRPSDLLLIAPPPMIPGTWTDNPRCLEESKKLPDAYRLLAGRHGIRFADAGAWNIGLTYDGVHFTPEGHAAFAAGLSELLHIIPSDIFSCP